MMFKSLQNGEKKVIINKDKVIIAAVMMAKKK